MAFEWKDKKDGVDDILADDINDMAHAIIEGLTDIAKLNKPAGVGRVNLSLIGRTTAEDPETATITENTLASSTQQSLTIDCKGNIDFEISATNTTHVYIDGTSVNRFPSSGGTFAWNGEIKDNIHIRIVSTKAVVSFTKFVGDGWVSGLMSGEQAKKLENTYTKEESDSRFAENKVASATTKETTLEQLYNEGKVYFDNGTVTGNKWTCPGADSLYIDVQGKVSFNVVDKSENMKIKIDGVAFEGSEFNGIVQDKILLYHDALSFGFIEFASFSVTEYTGGIMSGEDKEKLENTPTTAEVNNLIAEAFGTVEAVFDEVHEYAESLGGDEA